MGLRPWLFKFNRVAVGLWGGGFFAPYGLVEYSNFCMGKKCIAPTVWLNILISVLGEKCFAPTFFNFL